MHLRLIQIRKIAIDLKPSVRESVEASKSAKSEACRIGLVTMHYHEAVVILSKLEVLSTEPDKVTDASFISQKLIKNSGDWRWQTLHDLIEKGK